MIKSKIPNLIQSAEKDHTYYALQDAHKTITDLQTTVQGMKINSSDPFGKVDGANQIFRSKSEPAFIVVNGVVKVNGIDFNFKDGYIKFVTAPPTNAVIKAFHL